jgi:hypothetical protein
VHLAGETHAGNFFRAEVRLGESLVDRRAAGAPPVFRLLLGPSDLRGRKWNVLFGRGCDEAALPVDDQGARAAGANIYAK